MSSTPVFDAASISITSRLLSEVVDLHDGTALSNATVVIKELDIGDNTDKDGFLVFENLCDGQYNLSVNHDDCEALTIKVVVKKVQSIGLNLSNHSTNAYTFWYFNFFPIV